LNIEKDKQIIMKKKIIPYLSYGSLIAGLIIGGYAFVKSYVLNSGLPAGVCPITNNRPLMYTAIVLCGVSYILSFFESKVKET